MGILKFSTFGVAIVGIGLATTIAVGTYVTEQDIGAFQARIATIAADHAAPQPDPTDLSALPDPVQRYFGFVFPDGIPDTRLVRLTAEGQFRRPQTDGFQFTTAEQVIAIGEPALMFSATTPILPGIWARAYDYFANGEMEMKAKILSTLTVVDEKETPRLNEISLRRWLLESALFPHALLPGGSVTWDAIDDNSARATVSINGMSADMIAHFDAGGQMLFMVAPEDGDLNTPYHGSGEHVTRSEYRLVNGIMIPHKFVISRAAGGQILPFFDAKITAISFE